MKYRRKELPTHQGRIQDFQLGEAHLKKMPRAEGGAKIFGVFRVKNHDLMPKNHIFSNCGGRRENFWGISCEKSQSYAKKIIFSPILGGARAGCAPRWIRPWYLHHSCHPRHGQRFKQVVGYNIVDKRKAFLCILPCCYFEFQYGSTLHKM